MYDGVMDTQTKFAEGDLVEYVGRAFTILEGDARFGTLQKEGVLGGLPWLLVLTPEAQKAQKALGALGARPDNIFPRDERDRLNGWLVREDEIRKVEG